MSRRRLLGASLGGAGATLLGLAGCAAPGGSASAGSDHLSLWYWKGSLSEKLLATAGRGVPGVPGLKVRGSQIPDGDIDSKVRTSLAARAYVPDITVANSDNLATFYNADYALVMAGALMSVVPLIVVFLLGARHFLRDLAAGATKM